jgi:hypothetical protein
MPVAWLRRKSFSEEGGGRGNTAFELTCMQIPLSGMLSACANPVLYGLLNENFKTEFKLIFKTFLSK